MAEQQNDPEMSDDELYAKHNFEEEACKLHEDVIVNDGNGWRLGRIVAVGDGPKMFRIKFHGEPMALKNKDGKKVTKGLLPSEFRQFHCTSILPRSILGDAGDIQRSRIAFFRNFSRLPSEVVIGNYFRDIVPVYWCKKYQRYYKKFITHILEKHPTKEIREKLNLFPELAAVPLPSTKKIRERLARVLRNRRDPDLLENIRKTLYDKVPTVPKRPRKDRDDDDRENKRENRDLKRRRRNPDEDEELDPFNTATADFNEEDLNNSDPEDDFDPFNTAFKDDKYRNYFKDYDSSDDEAEGAVGGAQY